MISEKNTKKFLQKRHFLTFLQKIHDNIVIFVRNENKSSLPTASSITLNHKISQNNR